jgi:HEPN domain-containing protein
MTTEEKVQYWVELSDGDLEVAATMLRGKHYLYVGFMCHQSIEKIFKACYAKSKEDTPPRIHNLAKLAAQSGFYEILSDEQKEFIHQMEPLNIESRYPEYKKSVTQTLDYMKCEVIIEQTKTFLQWTKQTILSPK